ncbi:hypothetical protein [Mitsuaria sp. GD03876]|uniref:hypothetical protein n=1 Tax=Mitsuaria sp. GD03876 TaxID=2975399 RepID=UPI00244814D6|nr:hypothetical protein [Mitsuaria sp. GD03876]MDH0864101.1 hypothetical protein [Mitsuaria sp. GD03876]
MHGEALSFIGVNGFFAAAAGPHAVMSATISAVVGNSVNCVTERGIWAAPAPHFGFKFRGPRPRPGDQRAGDRL